ncbi:hypothetical protein DFH06DRAFT_1130400 [Mycena polygramma]|nr:hypothetical protein DFH06DRAFT_1130400 [Mycena polygramma]
MFMVAFMQRLKPGVLHNCPLQATSVQQVLFSHWQLTPRTSGVGRKWEMEEGGVVLPRLKPSHAVTTQHLGPTRNGSDHGLSHTTQVTWEKIQLRVLETRAMVEAGLSREPSRGNTKEGSTRNGTK